MTNQQKMLKNLKKGWAVTLFVLSVIIFSGVMIAHHSAMAQGPAFLAAKTVAPEYVQKMTYEVYAGGINAVKAEMELIYIDNDRYYFSFTAETKGLLGKLAPWSGSFETRGWSMEDGEKPELHKTVSVWRDKEEVKEYHYGVDGTFKDYKVTEAGKDKTPDNIRPELTHETIDVLTTILNVMKEVAAGNKCEGTSEVFDGKRRFKMIFKHDDSETLESSRYNVYAGEAVRCQVEVKPVAGAWRKKPRGWMSIQEQGREKGTMPTVWLASISEGHPAVPVKVMVATNYGVLFMHLVGYQNGEKSLPKK